MGGYTDSEGFITLNKKVELKPYRPRTFKDRLYLTDNEILSFTKHPAFINVEVYPNYFLLTVKINGKFLNIECGNNLSFNPKFLSWLLFNYKTVGFNSIKYDLLMIWLAYYNQNTNTIKSASNDLILNNMRDHELKKEYKFLTHVTSHVDLLEVAPLKGSLKLYGARLHTESIQEQPFDVDKELSDFEIEELKKFNCNQLDITEQLFDFMKERLDLRESLGNEYHENLMSKSDAQIAEVILVKEVAKLNGKRPSRNDVESGTVFRYSVPHYINYQTPELKKLLERIRMAKFTVQPSGKMDIPDEVKTNIKIGDSIYKLGIGGLHSSEKTIAYIATENLSIVDKDVQSYYPRIVTNLKLCPQSMGNNFLVAYEKIISDRLDAKKRKLLAKDKGLKIAINGAGGKFSDFYSALYAPDLTIQMTVTGQLSLLLLIEMLESSGIKVISANTDGIVMLVEKTKENELNLRTAEWERQTNFITEETRYSAYYARDCNNYIALVIE